MKKIIITIDGPASSGKGRIAKYIAKKYNVRSNFKSLFRIMCRNTLITGKKIP